MQETYETQVQSLGEKGPLEKGMAIHSIILAWRIPCTEEPGGYSSRGHKDLDTTEGLTVSSVQSLSRVQLFATHEPQHARPPCPSPTPRVHPNPFPLSWRCHPTISPSVILLPSIFPSIRLFSNESALRIKWPKYWSFSFSISPSNEHPGLISF